MIATTTMQLWPGQPRRIYEPPATVLESPDWTFQVKKNGWRDIVHCGSPDEPMQHFNRHGEPAADDGTDWSWLAQVLPAPFILDTEKMGFRQAGADRNYRFIIDCPLLDGVDRTRWPYDERLALLRFHFTDSGRAARSPITNVASDVLLRQLWAGGRFFGCNLEDIWTWLPTGQQIALLSLWPITLWRTTWAELLWVDPEGPNEGLVFKRSSAPLAWHPRPGVKDPWQLKLRRKG